ncbi:hypothetical protein DFS34DRAFT_466467 [Phlyctochytrium arcticum]|nr:hypothetical protein DFS34DRAFT_466467 [Phlyctochytrium arcticum]
MAQPIPIILDNIQKINCWLGLLVSYTLMLYKSTKTKSVPHQLRMGDPKIIYRLLDPNRDDLYFQPWQTAFSAVLCVETFAIILANLFTIIILAKNRHLHTLQNWLLLNVMVTDLCVGFSKFAQLAPNTIAGRFAIKNFSCQFAGYTDVLFCAQSVSGCLLLSYERYMVIVRCRRLTAGEVYFMIGMCWCISALLASLPYWFGIAYVIQPSMVYCNCDWSGPKMLLRGRVLLYAQPRILGVGSFTP